MLLYFLWHDNWHGKDSDKHFNGSTRIEKCNVSFVHPSGWKKWLNNGFLLNMHLKLKVNYKVQNFQKKNKDIIFKQVFGI
jgi:hypothetical protein